VTQLSEARNQERPGLVDLHLHSTASDGAQPPSAVVRAGAAAGLVALALTDHDTCAGVPDALREGQSLGIEVIAGVELSVYQEGREAHLLGLHLEHVEELERRLEVFRNARRARAEEMVARLNAIGVRISFADVLAASAGAAIGRPHVAKALVDNGWARDFRDAFDRYLGNGRPAYLDKRLLSPAEAIAMVHACGGITVLAHPGPDGTRERLAPLVTAGLDGLEVLHPSHNGEDRARLLALATHFELVPSGGSDSHGAPDGTRQIGAVHVPAAWVERQRARAEGHRSRARVA
jgi:3',5'-nucleoside bisphosphate phosphatase